MIMANNLQDLINEINASIDPNAGIGGILASNHNNLLKNLLNNLGKYAGLGYNMRKEKGADPILQGELSFENHNFNETSAFEIFVSVKNNDGNDIQRILDLLLPNALIHIKDFKGRSAYFKYNSYTYVSDSGNDYIKLNITGFDDNPNYVYQANEVNFGTIEFVNVAMPASASFISNVKIKYFNLYNDYLTEGTPEDFYAGDKDFTLANNEIGLFYWQIIDNDADVYDTEILALFTKGAGTWNNTNCVAGDFIQIEKYPPKLNNIYTGEWVQNGMSKYINFNYNNTYPLTNAGKLINMLIQAKADGINTMNLSFRWSNYDATYRKSSTRIDGYYQLLEVWFKDFQQLHGQDNNLDYFLYIDRWRSNEKKKTYNRKSNYRHEIIPDNNSYDSHRINEIKIDSERMILDFNQDYYFKPFTSASDKKGFPAPMGTGAKRQIIKLNDTSLKYFRLGFVDLAFRIVAKDTSGNYLFSTPHLAQIRMTGHVFYNKDASKYVKYITYKNIGRM